MMIKISVTWCVGSGSVGNKVNSASMGIGIEARAEFANTFVTNRWNH